MLYLQTQGNYLYHFVMLQQSALIHFVIFPLQPLYQLPLFSTPQ